MSIFVTKLSVGFDLLKNRGIYIRTVLVVKICRRNAADMPGLATGFLSVMFQTYLKIQ